MNAKVLAVIIIYVNFIRLCLGKRYDNFSLYRAVPKEIQQLKFFQNLKKEKYMGILFWKEPNKLYKEVQFLVPPKDLESFNERIEHFGIHVDLVLKNVQDAFDAQSSKHYRRLKTETYNWEHYHTLDDIYQWLRDISFKNPNVVKLNIIGKSVENRSIYAVGLNKRHVYKGKVVIEAGIHGNEWISTEFVTYLINTLVYSSKSKNRQLKEVVSRYEWHLVPVVNPDGYEYSHKTDRLWKKNRKYHEATNSYGVNLNRNFDYNFCKDGATQNPVDDTYCGPRPFSEPETNAFANFVSEIAKNNLLFFFSFHAYGQKLIIPLADRILHVGNYREMENYGSQAVMKMFLKHGVNYTAGTTYDTLGETISGNSASWVKKKYDVKYVFTFLLRDSGSYGYALPPNQILPTCQETLTGLLEIMTASPRLVRANRFNKSPEMNSGNLKSGLVSVICEVLVEP